MRTEIITIDGGSIDSHMNSDKIRHAAEIIRRGGLVAFPTETVYGLGANALDEAAVRGIFAAKGRPDDNPLIVHIAEVDNVDKLVGCKPPDAGKLTDRFWPGPLTLIMKKSAMVPMAVTAGLDTVAVRMPSHPVARALIREAGLPIAAPSANTSGKPSPTTAKHVKDDMDGKVDIIIDAGNADVGLESTVLDISVDPPVILRPGGITYEQLREVLPDIRMDPALLKNEADDGAKPKSPGMKYKHYAPKAQVIIVEGEIPKVTAKIRELADRFGSAGKVVGVLATEQTKGFYPDAEVISFGDRDRPATAAANLFGSLREFDDRKVDIILAEGIDNTGIGLAVMNRMKKAAGYNIIRV